MTKYNEIESKDNMKIETETKTEKPKVKAILDETPAVHKKSLFSRATASVFGPHLFRRIFKSVGQDIVIPALKNVLADSITSGVNMALFGDSSRGFTPPRFDDPTRRIVKQNTNYSQISNTRYSADQPVLLTADIPSEVKLYKIPSRQKAAAVLKYLINRAHQFGDISVADYYGAVNAPHEFPDNNYGWSYESLARGATIAPVEGMFIIKFPPVELL